MTMNTLPRHVAILCLASGLVACASPIHPPSSSPGGPASDVSTQAAAAAQNPASADCHPSPDTQRPQYIVGYGSLMQDESRKRTTPQAGPAYPVEVSGYRRGWFAKGDPIGLSTTYLGVLPEATGHLNAVIYRVEVGELTATDQREASYCRRSVAPSAIMTLGNASLQISDGQAWIYTNLPDTIALPSVKFPIVQSYVDIFLSGCLEQEQRFALQGFARQCLSTTGGWSEHWVNDRLYPRRPFIYQPRSRQIDTLLSQHLPQYFSHIRVE